MEARRLLSPLEAGPPSAARLAPNPLQPRPGPPGPPFGAPRHPLWLAGGLPFLHPSLPRTAFPFQVQGAPSTRLDSPPRLQTEPHLGEIEILDAPAEQPASLSRASPQQASPATA